MSVSNKAGEPMSLKHFQKILQKTIGNEVVVVKYATAPLVAVGENYGSLLLKVDTK